MKTKASLAAIAILLVSGCASMGRAPDLVIDPDGGRWSLVSCHIDQRGCRDEAIYRSEVGCDRAADQLERENRDRRAACRRLDD